jgi:beta-galactosidase
MKDNRLGTRTLTLTNPGGVGLKVKVSRGEHFAFTARTWTSEELEAAQHTVDLEEGVAEP